MPTTPYCTMDTRGLLYDPPAIIDARLTDYFYSLRSQDSNFKVKSLIHDLARSNNNEINLIDNISASVRELLQPYFEETNVNVTATDKGDNKITIIIYISVVDEGVTYQAGRDLATRNSKLLHVTEIYNS